MHEDVRYDSVNTEHTITDTTTNSNNSSHVTIASPNYSLVAYRNTRDAIYIQFRNNMIMPTALATGPDLELFGRGTTDKYFTNMPEGLYIVEAFAFPRTDRRDIPEYIDYYTAARGFGYSQEATDELRAKLLNRYTEAAVIKNRKKDRYTNHNAVYGFTINIITFVPHSVICENSYVYINGPGIAASNTVPEYSAKNPYSREHLESIMLNRDMPSDGTSVNIVLVTEDNKPMYIAIGNEPVKVMPLSGKEAMALPNGCSITKYRKGRAIGDKYINAAEFEQHGIYDTKEMCIDAGDKTVRMEAMKMNTEVQKSELERDKVIEAKSKLVMDGDSRRVAFGQDLANRQLDIITTVGKSRIRNIEMGSAASVNTFKNRVGNVALASKASADITRNQLDIGKAVMAMTVDTHKANLSMMTDASKLRREEELHALKMSEALFKLGASILK